MPWPADPCHIPLVPPLKSGLKPPRLRPATARLVARARRAGAIACLRALVGAGLIASLHARDDDPSTRALPSSIPPTVEYVSRTWMTDHGLPHNVVTRIQQDALGFLWLATPTGLTRFDGREFKVFPIPSATLGRGRNIRDLAITEDGTLLLIPASGGIWQVRQNTLSPHPASAQLADELLLEVFAEPGNGLWIQTSRDLVHWRDGRLERFGRNEGISLRMLHFSWSRDRSQRTWIGGASFFGYYRDGKLVKVLDTPNVVFRVAPARSGGVWVFGAQLYKYEDEKLVAIAPAPWPPGNASARCLYEDRMGGLWVGSSREGVFRYDGRSFQAVTDVDVGVESVNEDREGNIWLATDGGGIRRLRAKAFTVVDVAATSISEDAAGTLWFAGQSAGVVRRDATGVETIPIRFNRSQLAISAICPDNAGNIWMGSAYGIFMAPASDLKNARRIEPSVRSPHVLHATANGDVWVGSGSLGVFHDGTFRTVPDAVPPGHEITTIVESEPGHLWLGTSRGALLQIVDGKVSPASVSLGIGEGAVHAIRPQASGVLWIGTTEGLVRVDGDHVRRFTQANGLPDDLVLQLLEGSDGDLWIGTPRGIFRLTAASLAESSTRLTAIAYGPEQGLFGISATTNYQPSTWKDARGNLWFCTYKGAICIHPDRLQHDTTLPPVLIEGVDLDDRPAEVQAGVRIPPGEHRIEFRFAALSFAAPELVQLRHQLEGFDATWVDTAPDRTARYAKLPPGSYRMHVIASNSEGVWNHEGATLAVIVLPAWWQTAWFRTVAVLAFAGLIGWGVRFWSQRKLKARLDRLERENALAKERARIARDMHDELGGSVTGITLVVQRLRDEQGEQAATLVDLLDRRVRRLTVELERVVWTVSPKNTSLDQLATFVERFAHNLFTDSSILCRVHGRPSIPARPLNPECQHHVLAVTKEAVNNVLKHSHATEATITMSFADNVFTLSVRDNGTGFSPEAQAHSERNGLRNMRSRVAEVRGVLTIRSSPGQGTEVTIGLPL